MNLGWCSYFNYLFLNYCIPELSQERGGRLDKKNVHPRFQVQYQWSHLNYTWDSPIEYQSAIQSNSYIPENNAPVGMKIYKKRMFLSIPRFRSGVPATLAYLDMHSWSKSESPLLCPFPNWSANDVSSCSKLQSVQSMEIDTEGILWVIDGVRINNYTRCPTKLVLFDLNNGKSVVHTYTFPQEMSLQDGGFLNDLVVDESDGGFAYITDNSNMDPGIIVYSRQEDRSWKLRDMSMFPEPKGSNFPVDKIIFDAAVPVGIIIDEKSNMFLTMLPLYGVAKWNTNRPFLTSKIVDQNRDTMVWPDGFAFDQNGYLYVISNKIFNYIDPRRTPVVNGESQFRVLRLYTGTRSYLYA